MLDQCTPGHCTVLFSTSLLTALSYYRVYNCVVVVVVVVVVVLYQVHTVFDLLFNICNLIRNVWYATHFASCRDKL